MKTKQVAAGTASCFLTSALVVHKWSTSPQLLYSKERTPITH